MLGISRGSVHYLPRAVPAADLALMRRIDALHLEYPSAGSRVLKGVLKAEGHLAGRLHVATLMKRIGIEALYRRPRTLKRALGHAIFPYLLRKLLVTRPNQVWAMDITHIAMARGFFAGRLKTLRGLTPYDAICKGSIDEPSRFTFSPHHQIPRPNI